MRARAGRSARGSRRNPTILDITAVLDRKLAAMSEMKAQSDLRSYCAERAGDPGNHARRSSGNAEINQAGAFQRVTPQVASAR